MITKKEILSLKMVSVSYLKHSYEILCFLKSVALKVLLYFYLLLFKLETI